MGAPTLEVGYTSATGRRGDHESSYEHVVALDREFHITTQRESESGIQLVCETVKAVSLKIRFFIGVILLCLSII